MGQESSKYNLLPENIPIWKPRWKPEEKVPPVNIPPPQSNKPYEDWSQTLQITPQKVFYPTSSEEIKDILNELPESENVSVIASAHSSSRIWITGTLITLSSMPKMFKDVSEEGEPAFSVVKISANTSDRGFMQLLAKEGRTLPATGGVDEQQVGGLFGTNTAPASKEVTIYSDTKEIEYVTKHDAHNRATGEDLKAFIPNLGLVGVVTYITIGTIPDYKYGMKAIQRIMPVQDLVPLMIEGKNFKSGEPEDGSEANEKEYDFWRCDCLPQLKSDDLGKTDMALLWAARKIEDTNDPAKDHYEPDGDYVDQYNRMPLSMLIFCEIVNQSLAQYRLDPYNGPYTAAAYDMMQSLIKNTPEANTFYGPQRNMLPVDRFMNENVFCAMAEWAFLPNDIATVLEIYKEYFHHTEWPNLPIEVEYVKCDDNYMSPWNSNKMKGGPVEYLVKVNTMWFFSKTYRDLNNLGKSKTRSRKQQEIIRNQIEVHAEGLWNQLKEKNICFKAHWGKINFTTPEDVQQLYEWDMFKHYIQPQMMNDYFKQRLPKDL